MRDQNISMRQMMVMLFIALMALGAETIPGIARAGTAAWLAPLLAALPVLLLLWLAFRRPVKEERLDLGQGLEKAFGKVAGRGIAFIYLLWGLFLLVVNAARCARRLTMAEGTPVFFSAVVLLLAVWMAAGRLPAFVRTCEIFYLAIAAGLVGIVLLGGLRVQPEYVLLFTRDELAHVPVVAISVLGIISISLYGLFFAGNITVRPGDRARVVRWTLTLFLVLALLLFLIIGTFGAPLVEVTQRPFFQMVAGLGLTGAFQRLEAVVSALWMLGDVALLGLLLFGVKRLTAAVLGQQEQRWSVILAGGLAFVGGELLAGKKGLLELSQQSLMPLGSLLAGGLLVLLFFWVQHKERGAENRREEGGK
ncbi:MAG: spore gernimation protein [Firmicutes bacterium]|nr:spore gernimation protein [Bacillota bacterium]